MKRIKAITIAAIVDTHPYLDYLGEFSDTPGKFAIDHHEASGESRGSYQYFNAENVEDMEQARENYERMIKYDRGDLIDYGIKATAEIQTSEDGQNWLINKLSSGGVWGYPSDTDASEFEAEAENQLHHLKTLLLEFGFTEKEFQAVTPTREDWPL